MQHPIVVLIIFGVSALVLIVNGVHHFRPGRSEELRRNDLPQYYLRTEIVVVVSVAALFIAYALGGGAF